MTLMSLNRNTAKLNYQCFSCQKNLGKLAFRKITLYNKKKYELNILKEL